MQTRSPYISIVVPTLNEQKNIRALIKGIAGGMNGYRYELIVVDGHSTDGTVSAAKSLGAKILYDQQGKGSALMKGMSAAKGDIVISMDADLSNRPNELKLLIAGIEAGYDICMGSRFLTGGGSDDMPMIRRLGNKFFVFMVNAIYGTSYTDMCYGYRSFAKGVAARLDLTEKRFSIETEISIRAKKKGMKVLEVPSFEKPRAGGDAKLHSLRDGYSILKTILKNI
ncbi:MAG TPA: glycosyltransferase family 2 protein [Candidatus Acidoferrales bacterium]|nr:glycosyltransferase family 2 protein [Candidatus Acidoferrales bacterium]